MPRTSEVSEMIARAKRSIVQIWNPCIPMNGSGFIRDSRGFALTTEEVVGHATKVAVVLGDGTLAEGSVVGRDELSNLAAVRLRINNMISPLDLDLLDEPREGGQVVALGYCYGDTLHNKNLYPILTVTPGTISNAIKGKRFNSIKYAHKNRNMDPGIQGGPLLDWDGRLVGINVWPPFLLPEYAVEAGGHAHTLLESKALFPLLMGGTVQLGLVPL